MRWTVLRRAAISFLLGALAVMAGARTRPHYGGTLRVEVEGDALTAPDAVARRLIFDGLTRIGADGDVEPGLAERWEAQNGDHRWEFRLRAGVHFSDGTALTASAVEGALAAACGAGCPWTAVHAVGTAVIFTGDAPMPNLPALLAGGAYLVQRDGSIQANGVSLEGPYVGTGGFAIDGFANGVLTLGANDSCWEGRPFLDGVVIAGHKAVRDQWLDLSVGRADLVEVPAEQLRQAREQRLTVVESGPVELLGLSILETGALAAPQLRAAIALAVDRGALGNVIFQKQGEVTGSLLPQRVTGYAFLFPAERDLKKAAEARGGLTAPPLLLSAESGAAMQLAAQRLALNLREAGLNVQVAPTGRQGRGELALVRIRLNGAGPAAELEGLMRAAGSAPPVMEKTPAGLYRVEREFLERHTLTPLLYLPRAFAVGARVRDLRLAPDGTPLLDGVSLEDAP